MMHNNNDDAKKPDDSKDDKKNPSEKRKHNAVANKNGKKKSVKRARQITPFRQKIEELEDLLKKFEEENEPPIQLTATYDAFIHLQLQNEAIIQVQRDIIALSETNPPNAELYRDLLTYFSPYTSYAAPLLIFGWLDVQFGMNIKLLIPESPDEDTQAQPAASSSFAAVPMEDVTEEKISPHDKTDKDKDNYKILAQLSRISLAEEYKTWAEYLKK